MLSQRPLLAAALLVAVSSPVAAERSATPTRGLSRPGPLRIDKDKKARRLLILAATSSQWLPHLAAFAISDAQHSNCPTMGDKKVCTGMSGIEYGGTFRVKNGKLAFDDLELRYQDRTLALSGHMRLTKKGVTKVVLRIRNGKRTAHASLRFDDVGLPRSGKVKLDGTTAFVAAGPTGVQFLTDPPMDISMDRCHHVSVRSWKKTLCIEDIRARLPLPDGLPRDMAGGPTPWTTQIFTDPMDGSRDHFAGVQAQQTVTDHIDKEHTPRLLVRCQDKNLEVYVGVGARLDTNLKKRKKGFQDVTKVRLRFDDGDVSSETLPVSESDESFFFKRPRRAVRKLLRHKSLKVEMSLSSRPAQVVDFSLEGAKAAIDPVLAKCK